VGINLPTEYLNKIPIKIMSKEGSLDAPIRHPIDFEHPDFLNPEKLDAEMRRAPVSVLKVSER